MPRFLKQRNGLFSYYRRVPKLFLSVDPGPFVEVALGTRDEKKAQRLMEPINRAQEALWRALKQGDSDDARERYLGAIERARLEGFEYRSASDLSQGDAAEIMARLRRLEEMFPASRAIDAPPPPAERGAFASLLGAAKQPQLTLSVACEEYFKLTKAEVRKKSPRQLQVWKNARLSAVRNLVAIDGVGDKAVSEVSRADANAFRAWWVDRVVDEAYTPGAANKQIGTLADLLERLNKAFKLGMDKPLAGLRLKDDQANRRSPFTTEQLLEFVTDPRHLAGLNPEARGIVLVMVETGMRPVEICNLSRETILLGHAVPHVSIEPGENRELKTAYSQRKIPLVGVALKVLRQHPDGFPSYCDRSGNLSALVNPYLQRRGLLPTENHSLYSIRHSFKDRMRTALLQDEMMDALMGHKNPRPAYGDITLEQKHEVLLRIAITTAPEETDQMRLL